MASSSNVSVARHPWGRLPRAVNSQSCSSELEMSFRDIMAEQQRESSKEKEFEDYIQNSYVTVGTNSASTSQIQNQEEEVSEVEKSFLQLEDLDSDLKLVMSFYEDQDFEDVAYEVTEEELDQLADDESDKYYEGLAKKLSTVVELQNSSLSSIGTTTTLSSMTTSNRGSRTTNVADPNSILDPKSKLILEKLKQKGVLRGGAYKVVHTGKCATIFHATGGMLTRQEDPSSSNHNGNKLKLRLPKECAVKVFMSTSNPDNNEEEEERLITAKKEMAYLNRMTRAGIPCSHVQFIVDHVLVTDFLGKDGVPAKKLKNAHDLTNSRTNINSAYQQIISNMKTLFKTCHLVHGNLTSANILWHKRQTFFTDVGGAVNSNRSTALELLYRDCVNITEFFEKKGKPECQTPQELFRWITGFDFTGQLQHEEANGGTDPEEGFAIV